MPKLSSDGFHGRDNLEGGKVLVQRVLSLLDMCALLRSSSCSRWLVNAGRIGIVVKAYYFCLVCEENRGGERLPLCYFIGNIPDEWKPLEIQDFSDKLCLPV